MWTLHKEVWIDAAHFLPTHEGKCRNLHGHRWHVIVEIQSCELNCDGMVVDFGDIKEVVNQYDHRCLNDCPPFDEMQPTAENIAKVIGEQIKELIPGTTAMVSITIAETPTSSVQYTA